jgi:hypothetical protein
VIRTKIRKLTSVILNDEVTKWKTKDQLNYQIT